MMDWDEPFLFADSEDNNLATPGTPTALNDSIIELGSPSSVEDLDSFSSNRTGISTPVNAMHATTSAWKSASGSEVIIISDDEEDSLLIKAKKSRLDIGHLTFSESNLEEFALRDRGYVYFKPPQHTSDRPAFVRRLLNTDEVHLRPYVNAVIPEGIRKDSVFLVRKKPFDKPSTVVRELETRWKRNGDHENIIYYKNSTEEKFQKHLHFDAEKSVVAVEYRWLSEPHSFVDNPAKNSPYATNLAIAVIRSELAADPTRSNNTILAAAQKKAAEISSSKLSIPDRRKQVSTVRSEIHREEDSHLMHLLSLEQHVTFVVGKIVTDSPKNNCVLMVSMPSSGSMISKFCLDGYDRELGTSPLHADVLFKVGKYYLLAVSIRHPYLRRKRTPAAKPDSPTYASDLESECSVVIGPMFLLTGKTYQEYNVVWSMLNSNIKANCHKERRSHSLWKLTAVTDQEDALTSSLKDMWPAASHVHCFVHLKDNLKRFLETSYKDAPSAVKAKIVDDIFGAVNSAENKHYPGLVDCTEDTFLPQLESLQDQWTDLLPGFCEKYFTAERKAFFVENALVSVRSSAGFPGRRPTNNSAETANSMLRTPLQELGHSPSTLQIVKCFKRYLKRQEESIAEAIIGRGEFVFRKGAPLARPDIRLLEDLKGMQRCLKVIFGIVPGDDLLAKWRSPHSVHSKCLAVAFEDSDLSTDYEGMWRRATALLAENALVEDNEAAFSSGKVRFKYDEVDEMLTRTIIWDFKEKTGSCGCTEFKSFQLCSHVLVAADMCSDLHNLLVTYNTRAVSFRDAISPTSKANGAKPRTKRKVADRKLGDKGTITEGREVSSALSKPWHLSTERFRVCRLFSFSNRGCAGCGEKLSKILKEESSLILVRKEMHFVKNSKAAEKRYTPPYDACYHLDIRCIRLRHADFFFGVDSRFHDEIVKDILLSREEETAVSVFVTKYKATLIS